MRPGASSLTIRTLDAADREPIRQLLIETDVFTTEEVTVALELLDVALGNPHQKDYVIATALIDNCVAGYICVGPTPVTYGTFDLYWIAVKPAFQRHGVGKALLEHGEKLITSLNGRLIIVHTSSQPKYENTRAFYDRSGYVVVARIREYYKADDDLVIYGKYLSQ